LKREILSLTFKIKIIYVGLKQVSRSCRNGRKSI